MVATQGLLMAGQAKCHLAGPDAQQSSGNGIRNALAVYIDLDMLLMDVLLWQAEQVHSPHRMYAWQNMLGCCTG